MGDFIILSLLQVLNRLITKSNFFIYFDFKIYSRLVNLNFHDIKQTRK